MSVGHVSREFEAAGIPTVVIAVRSFEKRLDSFCLPRLLLTDELMGRPMGGPHDTDRHLKVLERALEMLGTATGRTKVLMDARTL